MREFAIDGRLLAYSQAGISQYTRQLSEHVAPLLADGERLTVLHSARHPRPDLQGPGIRYASVLTPPHHRLEQVTLPIDLLRVRPRVLHSPDFIPPSLGPWRRVITVHDLGFHLYPETVTAASRAYYGQVGRAVRVADAVIAVSQHTAEDIREHLDIDDRKLHVIPNGVDPALRRVDDLSLIGRWRTTHAIDRPFILYAGTFEPRKNLPLLIEAFARLRDQHDVLLVLLGARGWLYEPTFERIEGLGVGPSVRIIEGAPRHDYPIAYSCATVAVTPSVYEGFGLPVLEAMTCGAPVVASNASSLPEVVGDAGLLFQSGDVTSLHDALVRVLQDRELADELRTAGFSRAASFSWDRSARQTLEVYREVAA